jgi:peroxisomal enoyl-CoA hydratase 2
MATTIDIPAIKALSWSTTTRYDASNIITYNVALGVDGTDLSLCFEGHPAFHALPTFGSLPVIAIMGAVTRSMAEFLPNFQPHNHVHGEHYLELNMPFPKAAVLNTTAKIVDIVDRRSGVTVCVGIWTSDYATGRDVCYNEWTSFVMKVPGAGAASKPIERGTKTASHPAPNRKPDAIVEQKTSPEQSALYRAASGDLNPLHIDPAVAKAGGFPGPILTGTCTIGIGVKHIIDTFADGDSTRFRNMKLRLSKPVFPGETVRTEMWSEEDGKRIIYRQLAGDKVVISQAAVELGAEKKESFIDRKRKAKM